MNAKAVAKKKPAAKKKTAKKAIKPIDLHYWPTPNGWKLTILLEEAKIPYNLKLVNIGAGRALSGMEITPANFGAYDGWMMIEAFGLALPELAAATKIWRRMYESERQLATDGLNFMKTEVAKRW